MRTMIKVGAVLCVLGLAVCANAQEKTAAENLQAGIFAQEIESDAAKAAELYNKVIADPAASEVFKAQAMLRQGQCYVLLDEPDQGIKVLTHLVRTYPGQAAVMEKANAMLKDLIVIDPASVMPANCLAYAEVGSPGHQIETLLNMLQGTPLEASLQAGPAQRGQGGPQNIGQILQALRNPSMISEFKKIRGLAVGITGLPENGPPPFVAILLPGKSDALRGLLTVGLQVAARPMDAVNGLQAYRIPGGPAAAFDDRALIVAYPESQLAGVVNQYKNALQTTGLAQNSRFVAGAPAASRKENALTVWVDADRAYDMLMKTLPANHMPQEIIFAQVGLDLPNLDYATKTLSIQPDGLHANVKVALKEGHQCLAYNMVHTPALTRTGFEAIPSNAALVISMALGAPESTQAKVVQDKVQQLTGLDIGREIFANIEQISIFAVPANNATPAYRGLPPLASQIGFAVTSHNPVKTHQLLNQWLSLGHFIVGQATGQRSEPKEGQYDIGVTNGQKMCCYLNQTGKTTLLSLSPGVIRQSEQAVTKKQSAFDRGPLSAALKALPATTSKLVLINVGQVIETVLPSAPPEIRNQFGSVAADLSEAMANTVIQVNTEEGPNSLGVHVGINELPEIGELMPAVMQLAGAH